MPRKQILLFQWNVYLQERKLFLKITLIVLLILPPKWVSSPPTYIAKGICEKLLNSATNSQLGGLTHS